MPRSDHMTLDCPKCNADVEVSDDSPWGADATCPDCGCKCEVESELNSSEDAYGWSFWLVEIKA